MVVVWLVGRFLVPETKGFKDDVCGFFVVGIC